MNAISKTKKKKSLKSWGKGHGETLLFRVVQPAKIFHTKSRKINTISNTTFSDSSISHR